MATKELTGQKVAAILKKEGISRGYWAKSGRVAGWGSWIHGVQVEPVQKFNSNAGGGIRTKNGWKRDWQGNMVRRGAWQNTGTWTVKWQSGDHHFEDERGQVAKALKAFEAAGFTVEAGEYDGEWKVYAKKEEESA
jgi:hypothetical protein